MFDLSVKYNELTAEQFIELWETVWGDGPTLEQTELAMKHSNIVSLRITNHK